MDFLYLVPIFIGIVLVLFNLLIDKVKHKKVIEKPFKYELSNDLYALSFSKPFTWFINPDEDNENIRKKYKLIVEAGYVDKLNYRVLTTLQILILMISAGLFLIFNLIVKNLSFVVKFLFNVSLTLGEEGATDFTSVRVLAFMILLFLCLIPNMYLKNKAKANKFLFLKDLPVLQLFVNLMLRAKRPIDEVLFVLSKTNTKYKDIFSIGYRKYIRDKSEGFDYIKKCFYETKFEETVKILADYDNYSKSESLKILDNILVEITEYTNNLQNNKNISKLVFSQGSMIFPFVGVILLGFIPVAVYGTSFLDSANTII